MTRAYSQVWTLPTASFRFRLRVSALTTRISRYCGGRLQILLYVRRHWFPRSLQIVVGVLYEHLSVGYGWSRSGRRAKLQIASFSELASAGRSAYGNLIYLQPFAGGWRRAYGHSCLMVRDSRELQMSIRRGKGSEVLHTLDVPDPWRAEAKHVIPRS